MNGLYIGAMGMISNQNHINAHSNNIANTNTNGFKFDKMISEVFEDRETYRNEGVRTFIGDVQEKVIERGTYTELKEGDIVTTDKGLDVAITDEGRDQISFFVVSQNGKQYLTKNGEFELNENREIRTPSGAFVLDVNNQKIRVPEGADISVGRDGMIIDSKTGNEIATLNVKMVAKNDRHQLQKEFAAMFSYNGGNITDLPTSNAMVLGNSLEKSNVDLSKEMVELLSAQRRFQATQKITTAFDKVYEKEANYLIK